MATPTTHGITGYGGYVPRLRLQRTAIAAAHQWMAPGLRGQAQGQRAYCSWDEDSVTLAVEAARDLFDRRERSTIRALHLASTTLPFADLQHSSLVAAALGLQGELHTQDLAHSQRAGTAGLIQALRNGGPETLFIATDRPRGKAASSQEIGYGAGAAAFTLGHEGVLAERLGSASRSALMVDHFRATGARYEYHWEERWVRDEGYLKLVVGAVQAALQEAGVAPGSVNHFIVPSPLKGAATAVAKALGIRATAEAESLLSTCGYSGTAHGPLMLAQVLERAEPGAVIVVASFGLGADALVLRTTEAVRSFKPRRGVSGALGDALVHDNYLRMLSYEGGVELEWGMRAEKPLKTALTEQHRSSHQLASFVAGHCSACGTVQFPQLPYCVQPGCNAPRSGFTPHALFDEPGQVLTYTADWLSYHPAPPLYVGFVQFDQGARLLMEMTDVGPAGVEVGTPLRMVFRIKDVDQARAYPRYFWKATPLTV